MLAEIENGLVAMFSGSVLKPRLRQIATLPDLDGDTLIARFASDAPALYVATGSFRIESGYARPKFGIACVAKNSSGHKAARHGDGVAIGLLELVDAAMALVNGCTVDAGENPVALQALGCDFVSSEALFKAGLYVAVINVHTAADVALGSTLTLSSLADFKTFHADTDLPPHASASEHAQWLAEPPQLTGSAPDVSDTLILQE